MYPSYKRSLAKWLQENDWPVIMEDCTPVADDEVDCEVCHSRRGIYFTYGASVYGNYVCMGCLESFKSDGYVPTPVKGPLRMRFLVLQRDGFRCRYCGRGPDDGTVLQVDHVFPRAHGGTDSMENLVTACRECNIGKSDILLDEFSKKHPTK